MVNHQALFFWAKISFFLKRILFLPAAERQVRNFINYSFFTHPGKMYAIVEIKGQQFKVSEGQEIFVHRLDAKEGDQVTFDKVLLLAKDDTYQVGQPTLEAKVNTTVLEHLKGDKVIVFKKKRRKGYRKKNGHRQSFTKIKIDSIA
ncbi:ribosomal protein L21 [Saprospira grandis DSM 2844]|uniref:Large ribosomal subunit protein bL21 n=2 Tax=Saprospira TaxID=1007 RepID=J0XXK0_9BACT|nr:ribosomal protein L21 [Saprospira grandis DSM 2844]